MIREQESTWEWSWPHFTISTFSSNDGTKAWEPVRIPRLWKKKRFEPETSV